MWFLLCLHHQSKTFDLPAVFRSGGHNIDPGRIDAAVAQNICQLGNILLNAVKSPGKELAQIVRKYFGWVHTRRMTQPLHLCPYIAAIQWPSISCDKNGPTSNISFLRIIE